MEKRCVSCNTEISTVPNSVIFPCPNCGHEIVRCGKCRETITPYKCPNCGYEGP